MKKITLILLSLSLICMLLAGCSNQTNSVYLKGEDQKNIEDRLYPVNVNGKLGFIDKNGEMIAKPQYDPKNYFMYEDYDGPYPVNLNGKWGVVDNKGQYIVKPQYSHIGFYSDGLAAVRCKDGLGFLDKRGKMVIQPQKKYKHTNGFWSGMAAVMNDDGEWGYIDKSGKWVIDLKYDPETGELIGEPFAFENGLVLIEDGGSCGFIDIKGNWVIKPKNICTIVDFGEFSEGLISFSDGDKVGFYDQKGRLIIPCKYDAASFFSDGLAAVKLNGKYGYIDKKGCEIIPFQYDYAYHFSEGLAAVEMNGKYGYIDKTGQFVIQPQYEYAKSPSEGLAAVQKDGKLAYIDKNGKVVIQTQIEHNIFENNFSEESIYWRNNDQVSFHNGFAIFSVDTNQDIETDEEGLLNKEGKIIVQHCEYGNLLIKDKNMVSRNLGDGNYDVIYYNKDGQVWPRK